MTARSVLRSRLIADAVGFDEIRIDAEALAVALVLREAWEAEQSVSDITSPFRGQKVAVVDAPALVDELHPTGRESLECLDLSGINLVSDVAGDHV